MTERTTRIRLLAGIVISLGALFATTAVPQGNADAASINWLRKCNDTKSHPLHTDCTVTPPIQPHSLTYYDADSVQHTLTSPSTVWSFAKAHTVKCGAKVHKSCYGTDEISHHRQVTLSTRQSFLTTFFHG